MQCFVAVYEEGSYTAAAKRLGKTKAMVSTQITQLENDLKVQLVARTTRRISPTDTGIEYYDQAKQLLADLANLELSIKERHHQLQGKLRLSVPMTFGETTLMPFLASFRRSHPGLEFDIVLSDRYVRVVEEGFDAAIRIGQLEDSSLIAVRIGAISMHLCCSPDFYAANKRAIDHQKFQQLPFIADTNTRYRQLEDSGITIRHQQRACISVNSALAAATLAREGAGIALCPSFAVSADLHAGRLVELSTDGANTVVPVHLLYPHRKHLSSRISAMAEALKTFLVTVAPITS